MTRVGFEPSTFQLQILRLSQLRHLDIKESGLFANFRAPTATAHAELDEELLNEISRAAAGEMQLKPKAAATSAVAATYCSLMLYRHSISKRA